ncbi:MAG: hypothetical protein MZV70_72750 [Desulfobacterales bacterium]|nr:hypothetical protein [Desulfobacterales bacterium]
MPLSDGCLPNSSSRPRRHPFESKSWSDVAARNRIGTRQRQGLHDGGRRFGVRRNAAAPAAVTA